MKSGELDLVRVSDNKTEFITIINGYDFDSGIKSGGVWFSIISIITFSILMTS